MTHATIFTLLIPCPGVIKPVAVGVVHFDQLLGTACTGVGGQGGLVLVPGGGVSYTILNPCS